MKLFILILIGAWAVATILAALKLASDADDLMMALRRRNKRRHTLGKWLRFHGGLK